MLIDFTDEELRELKLIVRKEADYRADLLHRMTLFAPPHVVEKVHREYNLINGIEWKLIGGKITQATD